MAMSPCAGALDGIMELVYLGITHYGKDKKDEQRAT